MDCPRCKSKDYCKDGKVQGRQRYRCKSCLYRYSVEKRSDVKTEAIRRLALEMYLEGLGFRSIGRILKISHVTVYYWVKQWGGQEKLPVRGEGVPVVELDEIHAYVESKRSVAGYGLLLTDLENGLSLLHVGTDSQKQVRNPGSR